MKIKWVKPELIRIVRSRPEEAVLVVCKLGWPEPGAGSGENDVHLKCCETCAAACLEYISVS